MHGQGIRERVGPMVLRACLFCTATMWVACSLSSPVVLDLAAETKQGEVGILDMVAVGDRKLDARMQDIREAEVVVDAYARELDVAAVLDTDAGIPATTDADIIELTDQVDSHDGAEVADGETIDICVSHCTDSMCGDGDGCGGLCQGLCLGEQEECLDGVCLCVPDCGGKQCGEDGCGGECGECQGPQDACNDGTCKCQPACEGMECGEDGCDGVCGDCVDDEPCTVDSCVDGTCQNEYVPGCCDEDEDCLNELDCLVEVCVIVEGDEAGACDSYLADGHCVVPEDCEAKECQAVACEDCLCIWTPIEDCCIEEGDCGEAGVCDVYKCINNACVSLPLDCDDGDAASLDLCDSETGECTHCWPDCSGKECGDDGCAGECGLCPGEQDACIDGQCVCQPNCNCKECGEDGCGGPCGVCDDGNDCTADWCADHKCMVSGEDLPGCCDEDSDCEDGFPCTDHLCVGHECVTHVNKGCCFDDLDCVDTSPCRNIWCDPVTSYCHRETKSVEQQKTEGLECCQEDADCGPGGIWEEDNNGDGLPGPDDQNTLDYCSMGLCKHILPPVECDCGPDQPCSDGTPLTLDYCMEDCVCVYKPLSEWCYSDFDCDDYDYCTEDVCDLGMNLCKYYPKGACCGQDASCHDDDNCTWDMCFAFSGCYNFPIPACCNTDEECDDCDSCTLDYCLGNQCFNTISLCG